MYFVTLSLSVLLSLSSLSVSVSVSLSLCVCLFLSHSLCLSVSLTLFSLSMSLSTLLLSYHTGTWFAEWPIDALALTPKQHLVLAEAPTTAQADDLVAACHIRGWKLAALVLVHPNDSIRVTNVDSYQRARSVG